MPYPLWEGVIQPLTIRESYSLKSNCGTEHYLIKSRQARHRRDSAPETAGSDIPLRSVYSFLVAYDTPTNQVSKVF